MERKITILGVLRGIAVLAVCFCHLGGAADYGNAFKEFFVYSLKYGVFGVQIFFVISGFIIPYSLYRADYRITDYFRFLYKRILRLHPPYIVALAITLCISYISHRYRHIQYPETYFTIFKSLFYLHVPSDNVSFWTLQIEAEYYIFIGLFFIVLSKLPKMAMFVFIPILLLLSQTSLSLTIGLIKFIPYFLTGLVGYMVYIKENNRLLEIIALSCVIAFTFIVFATIGALVSLATILIVLFFKKRVNPILEFPGEISYSLYLLHFIIGVKIINFLQRIVSPDYNAVLFIFAFAICLFISWLFWRYVEKPATALSNKVKYGSSLPRLDKELRMKESLVEVVKTS